jgi:hypothetical protein
VPSRAESIFLDKPARPAFQKDRILDLKIVFTELAKIPSTRTAQL